MKIKDVIAKTDLTDRAIRLYIENGLVAPSSSETNSGRRSLDFSQDDVESLKNIATLRKAGFSIAQIKQLKEGGEECRKTVSEFIEKTAERIEADTAIINSLQALVQEDEISLETICDRLNMPTAQKSVPEEDLEAYNDKTGGYRILGFISLGIWLIFVLIQLIHHIKYFRFIKIDDYEIFYLRTTLHAITVFCSTLLIITNKTKKHLIKKPSNTSAISICSIIILFIAHQLVFFNMLFACIAPSVCSLTTNPKNYLKLDNNIELNQDIYALFPTHIPRSATAKSKTSLFSKNVYPDTTKYFYRYRNAIDSDFDIVAEWLLPDEDFEHSKEVALNYVGEIIYSQKKGDWNCIYYNEENRDINDYYYFLMFAYNEETKTVRYIISYCMDAADGTYQPYFLSLDW